jgi:hypothetical protein
MAMNDDQVIARISELVDEEHALERTIQQEGSSDESGDRLRRLEVALDQCWDLLRQRRARRATGEDPDEAQVRDPEIVEHYQQ